jgi:hypothetical protein
MFSRIQIADARRMARTFGVTSLLSDPDANPKLEKSLGLRAYSAPLHLAPAKLSGYEVCPKATAGCRAACLHTAGNPVYMRGKTQARIARTRFYFEDRQSFMVMLWAEIRAHAAKAVRLGMNVAAVRLNATSDIPWERVPLSNDDVTLPNIMAAFPHVQFYDYTKRANRVVPPNYHLTFSLAEDNDADAYRVLQGGWNVAAVFNVKRGKPLPARYKNWPVIDGDTHDYRPADPRGVIIGLRAKGQAIGDTSGFVRQVQ